MKDYAVTIMATGDRRVGNKTVACDRIISTWIQSGRSCLEASEGAIHEFTKNYSLIVMDLEIQSLQVEPHDEG